MVSARFLHSKAALSSFVNNKYFTVRYFTAMQISYSSNFQIIHLFVYCFIDSWSTVLLDGLKSTTIMIYFDAKNVVGDTLIVYIF